MCHHIGLPLSLYKKIFGCVKEDVSCSLLLYVCTSQKNNVSFDLFKSHKRIISQKHTNPSPEVRLHGKEISSLSRKKIVDDLNQKSIIYTYLAYL